MLLTACLLYNLATSTMAFFQPPALQQPQQHPKLPAASSSSSASPIRRPSGAPLHAVAAAKDHRGAYEDALALYKQMRADDDPYMQNKVNEALDVVEQVRGNGMGLRWGRVGWVDRGLDD